MLTQRLAQYGVKTDLSQVTPDDINEMVQRADAAKLQAQCAVVYGRAVKSVLKSGVKVLKSQADLYKAADGSLREGDKYKLDMLKSESGHQTHMLGMQAKSESEQQVAAAKQASVVDIERARLHGRLIKIGMQHRASLKAAAPKRQGLFSGGGLWS